MPALSGDVVLYKSLPEGRLELEEVGEPSDWLSVENPRTEPAQSLQLNTDGRIQGFVLLEGCAHQFPHSAQFSLLLRNFVILYEET